MEIKKNLIINLTTEDVKNIITEYVKKQGYNVCNDDLKFIIKKRYTEDCDERFQAEILCFEGCNIIKEGV